MTEAKNFIRKHLNIILSLVAFILTISAVYTGSFMSTLETVSVGSVATKRYVAPRDIVDTEETEKLKNEARANTGVLYKRDPEVSKKTVSDIEEFFNTLDENEASYLNPENETKPEISFNVPVVMKDEDITAYYNLSKEERAKYKNYIIYVVNEIYLEGTTTETLQRSKEQAWEMIEKRGYNYSLEKTAISLIDNTLKACIIIDNEATLLAREQSAEKVPDVIVRKNQKIVDEGEIITEKIYNLLLEANLINTGNETNFIPFLGSVLIILLIFTETLIFLKLKKKLDQNKRLILFSVYVLSIILLSVFSNGKYIYALPLGIFSMAVALFIGTGTAIILNLYLCIIGNLIVGGNMEFMLYFIMIGTFQALIIKYTEKRSSLVKVAFAISVLSFITLLSIGVFTENGYSDQLLKNSLYAMLSSLLTVFIVVGSTPIWENAFHIETPGRLLEFTNPDNKILRKLMIEAPGTYHHSLIVANLAENAAHAIGANPVLCRVAAYYHDIGKTTYPLYFSENQGANNVHDAIRPIDSARVIMEHTKLGVKLAEEYNLPESIKKIIEEHHGNTLVKYFYYKALKESPNENIDENIFRYKGNPPSSVESAIVMLADTVEAAVRSYVTNGKTMDEIEQLIDSLIKDKLDDNQLSKCPLRICDLETIKLSFLKVFKGMYHGRISYPSKEEIKKAAEHDTKNTENSETKQQASDNGAAKKEDSVYKSDSNDEKVKADHEKMNEIFKG